MKFGPLGALGRSGFRGVEIRIEHSGAAIGSFCVGQVNFGLALLLECLRVLSDPLVPGEVKGWASIAPLAAPSRSRGSKVESGF